VRRRSFASGLSVSAAETRSAQHVTGSVTRRARGPAEARARDTRRAPRPATHRARRSLSTRPVHREGGLSPRSATRCACDAAHAVAAQATSSSCPRARRTAHATGCGATGRRKGERGNNRCARLGDAQRGAVGDPDDVVRSHPHRPIDPVTVDERAVRGAHVVDGDAVGRHAEGRVMSGDVGLQQLNRIARRSTDRDRAVLKLIPGLRATRVFDHQVELIAHCPPPLLRLPPARSYALRGARLRSAEGCRRRVEDLNSRVRCFGREADNARDAPRM
jgi:hypothetical protein